MTLVVFEDLLNDVKKEIHLLEFDDLIRACREALGMHAYAVSSFMGIRASRLKSFECGRFCMIPDDHEFMMLEKLWGIPEEVWRRKAKAFIEKNVKAKKIRRVHER